MLRLEGDRESGPATRAHATPSDAHQQAQTRARDAAYRSRCTHRRRCMRPPFHQSRASSPGFAVCEQSPRFSGPPHSFSTSSCGRGGEQGDAWDVTARGCARTRVLRFSPTTEAIEIAKAAAGRHPIKQVPTMATCPASCFLRRCSTLHRREKTPRVLR